MEQQQKQGWDTRAWLVGILGGVMSGSVSAWAYYPPVARRINSALHLANASDWICGSFAVLGLLVLPGIVSGIARRRSFLWGLVPLVFCFAAMDLEDGFETGAKHVADQFWVSLLIIGGGLLLSSGPVSLFRWLRIRARHRREAAVAVVEAQREAASVPQEGVWPPPPDYRK